MARETFTSAGASDEVSDLSSKLLLKFWVILVQGWSVGQGSMVLPGFDNSHGVNGCVWIAYHGICWQRLGYSRTDVKLCSAGGS